MIRVELIENIRAMERKRGLGAEKQAIIALVSADLSIAGGKEDESIPFLVETPERLPAF